MAHIKCTIQEYHDFIGLRIRNAVQVLTKKTRSEKNGICEHCGKTDTLESAHIHGKGRRTIVEAVLKEYENDGLIEGDLQEIEGKILDAHLPLEESFKFLCKACHNEYDSVSPEKANRTIRTPVATRSVKGETIISSPDFIKIGRIKLWAAREHQDNHKIIRAYLEASKKGDVTIDHLKRKCTDRFNPSLFVEKFDGHFASMKKDNGNSHGKVFYEVGSYVKIYEPVMAEIRKYFAY